MVEHALSDWAIYVQTSYRCTNTHFVTLASESLWYEVDHGGLRPNYEVLPQALCEFLTPSEERRNMAAQVSILPWCKKAI